MSGREELIVIDATLKIESQQKIMRKYVDEFLKDYKIPDYLRIINEDNVI